jgi:hypothetical protein
MYHNTEDISMTQIPNNPLKCGCPALPKQYFGASGRYAIAPMHTRFDAVQWFVWDANHPDCGRAPLWEPSVVIRQEDSLEEAMQDSLEEAMRDSLEEAMRDSLEHFTKGQR